MGFQGELDQHKANSIPKYHRTYNSVKRKIKINNKVTRMPAEALKTTSLPVVPDAEKTQSFRGVVALSVAS